MSILVGSEYFTTEECTCKCGCGKMIVDDTLLQTLDAARRKAQVPFVINSWTRCAERNASEGGKEDSAHLHGRAVDISADSSRPRFVILRALLEAGFTRIGIAKTFLHADVDAQKDQSVVWLYS